MSSSTSDRYPDALRVGTALGEFTITDVIGEGGFGTVYLAYEETLDRTVAIKEYLPVTIAARANDQTVLVRSEGNRNAYAAGLQSFMREARLQARFSHPAMLEVYRVWEQNGTAYMAMRYYPGESLRDLRRNTASSITIDEAWIKRILLPVFDAVRELHSQSVLHRDVSPDNILILPSGAPVLLDFGAARMVVAGAAQSLTTVLKPGYAPIEQYAGDGTMEQGPWTDVYGLGAVLYFLAIGNPPPQAVTRMMQDTLRGFDEHVAGRYSDSFAAAIKSALAVLPENRLQSVTALIKALGWNDAQEQQYPLTTSVPTQSTNSDAKTVVDSRTNVSAVTLAKNESQVLADDDRTVVSANTDFSRMAFEQATIVPAASARTIAPTELLVAVPSPAPQPLPPEVSPGARSWQRSGAGLLATLFLLGGAYVALDQFWRAAPAQSPPAPSGTTTNPDSTPANTVPPPAQTGLDIKATDHVPASPLRNAPATTPTEPEMGSPVPTVSKATENPKATTVPSPTSNLTKSSPVVVTPKSKAPTATPSQAIKAQPTVIGEAPSVRPGCERIFAKLSLGTAELTEVERQKLAACK